MNNKMKNKIWNFKNNKKIHTYNLILKPSYYHNSILSNVVICKNLVSFWPLATTRAVSSNFLFDNKSNKTELSQILLFTGSNLNTNHIHISRNHEIWINDIKLLETLKVLFEW